MSAGAAAPPVLTSRPKPRNSLEEAIQKFNETLAKRKTTVIDVQRSQLVDDSLTVDGVLEFGRSVTSGWQPGKDEKKLRNFNKLLKSLQAYGPIVEVFIRPVPAVKSIIWGGVKYILATGVTYLDRLEDLAKAFEDLSDWLPIVLIYQRRAKDSTEIQAAVELFQESLVEFLTVLIDSPASTGFIQGLLPGFNSLKSSRERLERTARTTAATVTAVEHDLQNRAREEEKRTAFLKLLNPCPMSYSCYARAGRFKSPKTFSSIFDTPEFGKWLECDGGAAGSPDFKILDIVGAEHCGKSTVAAAFADQISLLFQDKQSLLCPVFLDGTQTSEFTFSGGDFREASYEILRLRPDLLTKELIAKYPPLTIATCQALFKEIATRCSPLYLLLDNFAPASAESFCREVFRLLFEGPDPAFPIRIFVFSSPYPHFYRTKWSYITAHKEAEVFCVKIRGDSLKEDVRSFVRQSSNEIAMALEEGQASSKLAIDIENALMKGATNNFLLMRTLLEYIRQQPTAYDVRQALQNLSPDIKNMYVKALVQISSYQDGRTYLTVEILKAVLSSFRPLGLRELAEFASIQPGSANINDDRRYSDRSFETDVQKLCGPLVMIEDQVVRAMSEAGKRFLKDCQLKGSGPNLKLSYIASSFLGRKESFESIAKQTIATKCISYLSLACFSGEENSLPALGDKEGWLDRFPFFDYASNCWLNHLFDLADHMKVKGDRDYFTELWFDADLLKMLSKFLSSSNTWTFLEGLLLFSSAEEARNTLAINGDPIVETEDWILGGSRSVDMRGKTRPEHPNARILEEWALGTYDFLGDVRRLPLEDALQVIRQSRQDQIEGTGMTLLEHGRELKAKGYFITPHGLEKRQEPEKRDMRAPPA